jgi:hypothetical protein
VSFCTLRTIYRFTFYKCATDTPFFFCWLRGGAKPVPTTLATGAGEVSSDVSTLLNFFVKVEGFVETCDRASVEGDDFSLDKTRCFGFDFVSKCCRYLFFFL